jgi:hypothetical protein
VKHYTRSCQPLKSKTDSSTHVKIIVMFQITQREEKVMRVFLRVFLVLLLVIPATAAMSQTQPYSSGLARALGNLVNTFCAADPSFEFKPPDTIEFSQGSATVHADQDIDTGVDSGGHNIRALSVTVTHGITDSPHVILYVDNDGSNSLTCLDTILAVT